jgi:hypothetical protein
MNASACASGRGIRCPDGVDDATVLSPEPRRRGSPVGDRREAGEGVPLDATAEAGHGGGDDLVAGCLGQRQVEGRVEREELGWTEVGGVHRVEQAVGDGEVGGRSRPGEVARDRRLEDQARAHDVGHRESACRDLEAHERAHAAAGGRDDDGARVGAGAGVRSDESEHLEHAQGLAHARPADAEFGREGALTGQPVARHEVAADEARLDVLEHGLPGARAIRHAISLRVV